MNTSFRMIGLVATFLAGETGCSQPSVTATSEASQERVSDRYSTAEVVDYTSYTTDLADHQMVLFNLRSGFRLPMLCKFSGNTLYPIPQSVFPRQQPQSWQMITEPVIDRSHVLMSLVVEQREGELFLTDTKLKKSTTKLKLIEPPK